MKWDVFLSHSSKDKVIVTQLRNELAADGIEVWFDEEQIGLGDSIPLKIEDGLEQSRIAILCLSEHFLVSNWTAAERAVFMYEDPKNTLPSILPVVISPCTLPRTLGHLRSIEYTPGGRAVVDAVLDVLTRPLLSSSVRPRKPLRDKLPRRPNIDYVDPSNSDTTDYPLDDDPLSVVQSVRHTIALLDHAVRSDKSGLIVLDLDGFTNVNNKYGRVGSDLLLETVDEWVASWCKGIVAAGRVETAAVWRGMDEWFIYIGRASGSDSGEWAKLANDAARGVGDLDYSQVADGAFLTACSGYAVRARTDESAITLLRRALVGLKGAKKQGPSSAMEGPKAVAKLRDDRAELETASWDISSHVWYMREGGSEGRLGSYKSVHDPKAIFGIVREPKYIYSPLLRPSPVGPVVLDGRI